MKMATEGLPLSRQERGADKGILAGADFLSVFMGSSLHHQNYDEKTTLPPCTTSMDEETEENVFTRATRSTSLLTTPPIAQEEQTSFYDTTISAQVLDDKDQSSDSKLTDGVIVAVRVSSSVGRTLINKEQHHLEETTTTEIGTEPTDLNFIASEEHPSIVAEANKSEFNVEESEPITTNSEMGGHFVGGYPASVHPLPRGQSSPFSSEFLNHHLSETSEKDKLQPIQQTVIYHNNPREAGRARSVSYSTVIQAVPHPSIEKEWAENKHERHERHFDGAQSAFSNTFHETPEKIKMNNTKSFQSQSSENPVKWEKAEVTFSPDLSTSRNIFTTERNWGFQEKPYLQARIPMIYGKPEQNYEVDESASVMTNGRIHGIQTNPTLPSKHEIKVEESKKSDDNQKVGYVVEGRNYRKYRVEERTADGFIVGEYGVVSHDDGSLRGVRYTADGTISPRLIYDALMKFLSL